MHNKINILNILMDYTKIGYVLFLLLVILASLCVYLNFRKKVESMVTIGSDLSLVVDIPGATYTAPTSANKNTMGINGYGLDVPQGYYKVDIGGGVLKMKPVIPTGYLIDPSDKKKLIVDPKNNKIAYAIAYYKNATDAQLNSDDIGAELIQFDTNKGETPASVDVPNGYYRISETKMKLLPKEIPKGYIIDRKTDPKDKLVFDITTYALSTFDSTYDATKVDTIYHDMPEAKTEQIDNDELGKYYTFDANGKLMREENTDASFSPVLYYVPGAYKYGSSNYVPNYEDSVYLSRTTRLPQSSPVYNTASMLGGFCTQFKNDKFAIEEKCGALDLNTCASTSCCTLIGGQKCVAGNKNGPMNPASYTDFALRNKDFYYYQGKCYGNCRGNY